MNFDFEMEEFTCLQPEEVPAPTPVYAELEVKRKAPRAPGKGVKRPSVWCREDIPERPNLIEIFDEFDVPDEERILLCATTAAFYRALNKKRKE